MHIYQFDLTVSPIASSKILVAVYDGYSPTYNPPAFSFSQLGPDNKIYIGAGNSTFIHVIENPDLEGMNCNVVQRALTMPGCSLYGSMPKLPNFRLGSLVGSDCDSLITSAIETSKSSAGKITFAPNPANDYIRFDFSELTTNHPMQFFISDDLGREMDMLNIAPFQGFFNYDVRKLADGLYIGLLKNQNGMLGKVKFIVNK